ncbi:o-succinylbenzoate synthase [Desulfosporosinus burensis]
MRLHKIILHQLQMPLKKPFETSFGVQNNRVFLLVEVHGKDAVGYGEVTVMAAPFYNEETPQTARHIIKDFLAPLVLNKEIGHPREVTNLFKPIRRNNMAKSGLEGAIWDLWAKEQGLSLSKALGGVKEKIAVGVSVGIQPSMSDLVELVGRYLTDGYRKIKVKIKPGRDLETVRILRAEFGDIPLMVDANSAYSLADLDVFKELDQYGLMMIEQPLSHDDVIDHRKLQAVIKTPICLDESIHTLDDARHAIELDSCRIVNIKVGRVGGLQEVIRIHNYCQEQKIPVWCGGMLESGVGRAHNLALSSLPNFTIPGDTSASSRYWDTDIIEPEVIMSKDGYIQVPSEPGIGFRVVDSLVKRYLINSESII